MCLVVMPVIADVGDGAARAGVPALGVPEVRRRYVSVAKEPYLCGKRALPMWQRGLLPLAHLRYA